MVGTGSRETSKKGGAETRQADDTHEWEGGGGGKRRGIGRAHQKRGQNGAVAHKDHSA